MQFITKFLPDITGGHHIGDKWGQYPITMVQSKKLYIATVTKGIKKTLQSPDSNVSLHIPEGNKGIYMMAVHTDHSKVCRVLGEKECFVSPIVEVIHNCFECEHSTENTGTLTISIPHCLSKKELLDLIRVKRGDILRSVPFQDLKKSQNLNHEDSVYFLDGNYIRIKTKKLSDFVCISCNITCQAAIQVFLLGSLNKSERINVSTVKVKPFLCSSLFKIAEYRNVSFLHILT